MQKKVNQSAEGGSSCKEKLTNLRMGEISDGKNVGFRQFSTLFSGKMAENSEIRSFGRLFLRFGGNWKCLAAALLACTLITDF